MRSHLTVLGRLFPAVVRALVALAPCGALACGAALPSSFSAGHVTPAEITGLEAARASHPGDVSANIRLTEAYYAAGRFDDARGSARATLRLDAGNSVAQVYLGLAFEGLARYDSAHVVYSALLAAHPDKSVRKLLAGRIAVVSRAEMLAAAREAIANESVLATTPPEPNTVAVLPFHYGGGDSTYRPLERGLAAVVVTDLSRVHSLRVLERSRLQAILDELKLGSSGAVDSSTSARSGRLLRAAQVVQGAFVTDSGARVRIDAEVVRATDAHIAASGSNSDRLKALFDVEKSVVFQLLASMGISLTPAEQVAISERPTQNLQAFLLFSRGLEESDRGDFSAASGSFEAASHLDPGFTAAAEQASRSQAAQTATAAPSSDLATAVVSSQAAASPPPPGPSGGALAAAIDGAVPGGSGVLNAAASASAITAPTSDPNRICEGATCDGPARAALIGTLTVILRLP